MNGNVKTCPLAIKQEVKWLTRRGLKQVLSLKLSVLCWGVMLLLLPKTVMASPPPEHGVKITTNVRMRYEYVDNQLPTTNAVDDAVVTRISTYAAYQSSPLLFEAELMDSRIFKEEQFTPVGTDDTNALEPVQFALSWRSVISKEKNSGNIAVKVGRFTMDIGSRRLVARNRFRNTLNTFDGIRFDAALSHLSITAFYTHPVSREPTLNNRQSINDTQLDSSSSNVRFFGVDAHFNTAYGNLHFYGFQDKNTINETQRNTLGHLANITLSERINIDFEAALQRGQYQSKKVRASFLHIALSSNFNLATLRLFYDVATGDDASTDTFEGFSTLFGARRFEYGPTGIFGVFARNNMTSLGLSSNFKINEHNQVFMQLRGFDIHQSGASGRLRGELLDKGDFLGTLSELRVRSQITESIYLETGLAIANLSSSVVINEHSMRYAYFQTTYVF
jgi:NADPH-dependent 7-cyano-7-deazaguanine reductase QueF-like protein